MQYHFLILNKCLYVRERQIPYIYQSLFITNRQIKIYIFIYLCVYTHMCIYTDVTLFDSVGYKKIPPFHRYLITLQLNQKLNQDQLDSFVRTCYYVAIETSRN